MLNPYDSKLAEELLSNDLTWLQDCRDRGDSAGEGEAAWNLYAHLGRLNRSAGWAKVPKPAESEACKPGTALAASGFVDALGYGARAARFAKEAGAHAPEDNTDAAEQLILERDEIEMGLEALERYSKDPKAVKSAQEAKALLWQADALLKGALHEMFNTLPMTRGLARCFAADELDRKRYWWWFDIQRAFDEAVAHPLGDLVDAAIERANYHG